LKKIEKILTTLLFLLSFQAFSQRFEMKIDSIVDIEIQDLKKNEVNEIGFVKWTSIGYGIYSTTYLFWSMDNSTFIQKFENSEYNKNSLKKFKALEIKDSPFFSYYDVNKALLNKENVGNFEYKPDSIVGNMTYSSRISKSHSNYSQFVIKTKNENFNKQFDYFNLEEFDQKKVYASKRKYTKEKIKKWEERGWEGMETEVINETYPKRNLNFELNIELKLVEWDKIMTEFIEKLESENQFELIKSE
jgi:hypothetical protein